MLCPARTAGGAWPLALLLTRSAHSLTRYAPSLTPLAAILYEQDMFKQWIPFCNTANELARPSRFQKLMHITMKFPMLLPISNRDVR